MAGTPKTRNWQAIEVPGLTGGRGRLFVVGDVQVTATNQTPVLSERSPQGINPRILLLDLKIVSKGIGAEIVFYKTVQFDKATSGNQYDEVDIFSGSSIIKRIKVRHVLSLAGAAKKKRL